MSIETPKLLRNRRRRKELKAKQKKRGKIKQIISGSPRHKRMFKGMGKRGQRYPEHRTETEKCRICGEKMLVSVGQVAKYHKACRKKRNSKEFRDKIKKGRKPLKERSKKMGRRKLKGNKPMSDEQENVGTPATPEAAPETPATPEAAPATEGGEQPAAE